MRIIFILFVYLSGQSLGAETGQKLWLTQYKNALSYGDSRGCETFRSLGQQSDFHLKDLAVLRAILSCKDVHETLSSVNSSKTYLLSLRSEAELTLAQKQNDWPQYLDLLQSYLSQLWKTDRERAKQVESALVIAKEKKLKSHQVKLEKLLYTLAPRLRKNPTKSEYLEIGLDLLQAREFDRARDYFKKIVTDAKRPIEERRKAFAHARNSYKIQQDKRLHLKEAQLYYQWLLKHKQYTQALDAGLYVSRALWTEGMKGQAQRTLDELERKLKRRAKTFDIDFIRGRMANEDGHDLKAILHFDKALANGALQSPGAHKVQYAKAWSLYRSGKPKEAAIEFSRAGQMAKEQVDHVRAQFWEGRAKIQAGMAEEGRQLLQHVAKEDPLGFYGLVSYRELATQIPPLTAAATKLPAGSAKGVSERTIAMRGLSSEKTAAPGTAVSGDTADMTPPKHLTTEVRDLLADLAFVGERRVLENLLNELTAKENWNWESNEGLTLLRSYAKAGLYLPLFSILTKIPREAREELLLHHPELLFPREYNELVNASAAQEGLPGELLLAIIRQESAFDPTARSTVDALGLMQVLPTFGRTVAKAKGILIEGHEDLLIPEKNVPIGAHLLKQNLDRYKGNLILGVAAYNANDRAIRNWLRTRFREDPLEFIEEIPYEETRGYVKLVLRNYIFYKRLNQPTEALAFPPECLSSLQDFKSSTDKEYVVR